LERSDCVDTAGVDDAIGLSEASTDDLLQLAAAMADGTIKTPLSQISLGYAKFGHLTVPMRPFYGLEKDALLGVIRAVLAERRKAEQRTLDLVWSGSDSGPSYTRYTKIVVPEMISAAKLEITIAGYSFDEGAGVFEQLHKAINERNVKVRMFLDIEQLSKRLEQQLKREKRKERLGPLRQAREAGSGPFAKEVLSVFRDLHWPFEGKQPTFYYDPRTADHRVFASLHAKCIIVDEARVLITSANFTGRGQDRNIEVGVVINDHGYASALERQWNNLVESEDVVLG
jgi:phosphatidylserine/phosphatidylglycerophosphate/cardiolipin synthase-like enzyme